MSLMHGHGELFDKRVHVWAQVPEHAVALQQEGGRV